MAEVVDAAKAVPRGQFIALSSSSLQGIVSNSRFFDLLS